jgi:hypothetical protein
VELGFESAGKCAAAAEACIGTDFFKSHFRITHQPFRSVELDASEFLLWGDGPDFMKKSPEVGR